MSFNLLGLSDAECKALECLYAGRRTASQVAEGIGIHRTNAYEVLGSLVSKGFASCAEGDGGRTYSPIEPDAVMSRMKAAIEQAQKHLSAPPNKQGIDVQVFQGMQAHNDILNALLERGEQIDVMGIPKDTPTRLSIWIDQFHRRRAEKKVHMRHLYNSGAEERAKYLNALPDTEAKILPTTNQSPVSTIIGDNVVVMMFWSATPLLIRLESRQLAQSYKQYFDFVWNNAK